MFVLFCRYLSVPGPIYAHSSLLLFHAHQHLNENSSRGRKHGNHQRKDWVRLKMQNEGCNGPILLAGLEGTEWSGSCLYYEPSMSIDTLLHTGDYLDR